MGRDTLDDALEAVRIELMREMYAINPTELSCITASEVATRVFRSLGVAGPYPLTVRVSIFNEPATAWFREHGIPETDEDWAGFNEAGGAEVYVGHTPDEMVEPGHWSGHLAVVLPKQFGDRHALFDPTIIQANRPDWGIDLPPLILKVSDAFTSGHDEFQSVISGTTVLYRSFPSDESYKTAAADDLAPMFDEVAARILRRLRR